ncbi:MAG: nucleoside deaminase [Devosia sp.]
MPSPMDMALELAAKAAAAGEAPVGAVIVENGDILAAERNRMRALNDPTAHAEFLAIRAALQKRGSGRLDGCDLYVTLEPCAMCAGAIAHVRLRRVIYAAADPKAGAVDNGVRLFHSPNCHHKPEIVSGIGETRAAELLRDFFQKLRL